MTISPEDFRDTLRHFAAGVTVVTAGRGTDVHGMTVSAFSSVSAEPPLVAVFINQGQTLNGLLTDIGAPFAVNFLAEDQVEISNRFAFGKKEERFLDAEWGPAVTGAPVLGDALAWLDCTVHGRHAAGSHLIYLGEVKASRVVHPDGRPLLYWNREYRRLARGEGEGV